MLLRRAFAEQVARVEEEVTVAAHQEEDLPRLRVRLRLRLTAGCGFSA